MPEKDTILIESIRQLSDLGVPEDRIALMLRMSVEEIKEIIDELVKKWEWAS